MQVECLQYCFTSIIREELYALAHEWNLHTISSKRNSECTKGKPDVMFFMPEMYGTTSYGESVSAQDVEYCILNYSAKPRKRGCSDEFLELVTLLKPGQQEPASPTEALELYNELCALIRQHQN